MNSDIPRNSKYSNVHTEIVAGTRFVACLTEAIILNIGSFTKQQNSVI